MSGLFKVSRRTPPSLRALRNSPRREVVRRMVFESAGLSLYEPGRRNPERSWDPCQGGFGIRSPANGRNRRILPVPGRAREGLFTAATADISLGEAATARFASKPASQTRRRCRPLARAHKLADPPGTPRRRLGTAGLFYDLLSVEQNVESGGSTRKNPRQY